VVLQMKRLNTNSIIGNGDVSTVMFHRSVFESLSSKVARSKQDRCRGVFAYSHTHVQDAPELSLRNLEAGACSKCLSLAARCCLSFTGTLPCNGSARGQLHLLLAS
jgi:hypothetical protein